MGGFHIGVPNTYACRPRREQRICKPVKGGGVPCSKLHARAKYVPIKKSMCRLCQFRVFSCEEVCLSNSYEQSRRRFALRQRDCTCQICSDHYVCKSCQFHVALRTRMLFELVGANTYVNMSSGGGFPSRVMHARCKYVPITMRQTMPVSCCSASMHACQTHGEQ